MPNDYAGRLARWELGRRGGYANVEFLRLHQAAATIARCAPNDGRPTLEPILEEGAVRAALHRRADAFGDIDHPSLQRALVDLFRELRRAEIDATTVSAASTSRATRAALAVYAEYQELIASYDDPTRLVDRATRRLQDATTRPPELDRLGAMVLYLPTRVDPADARFLAAAARWVPLFGGLIDVSDPLELGDRPSREIAAVLATTMGLVEPEHATSSCLEIGSKLRVLRAPDPAEEVRSVLRNIAADIEAGTSLHQVAIVYRQDDPYAPLVRDALDAAGLPWSSSEGIHLEATRPARCLLGLLRLPDRAFSRDALLEWLETAPPLEVASTPFATARWDRLSRAANVVRGADQWRDRLQRYATSIENEIGPAERDDTATSKVEGHRRQAADARALADFVTTLARDLLPPPRDATWGTFVDWAESLAERYVDTADKWPGREKAAFHGMSDTFASLRQADLVETEGSLNLATFLAALEAALAARRVPTGRLGDGILVEPIAAMTGLAFERVYLLGMIEGAFPPSPAPDPFFPYGSDDPLDRQARRHAKERQDFLVAVRAATGGLLTVSVPDSDGTRGVVPSRWLLELASIAAEEPVDATRLTALAASGPAWLQIVRSAQHGVASAPTPADLEDRRLGEVVAWIRDGKPLVCQPLAHRSELPLRSALELQAARLSKRFTAFDGNVGTVADSARRLTALFDDHRAISATAVQTWATCGFRYFLERVLAVEPTERPVDEWTIDPLERGSLIHTILEKFFRDLHQVGRPGLLERYQPFDVTRIEGIAAEQFIEIEQRGVVGHPLTWEITRRSILADLRAFLDRDEDWRITRGLVPTYFEQPFGFARTGSWPAVRVACGATQIGFRGYIDRIDLNPESGRAYVFDYKTGSSQPYDGLASDPVSAGQHIQLALYAQAVLNNQANITEVGGAYWFVTSKGEFKQRAVDAGAETVKQRLSEVVDGVSRGIRQGVFPQVPGQPDRASFKNCGFCDFDRVCASRRDRDWDRKHGDTIVAFYTEAIPSVNGHDGAASEET